MSAARPSRCRPCRALAGVLPALGLLVPWAAMPILAQAATPWGAKINFQPANTPRR